MIHLPLNSVILVQFQPHLNDKSRKGIEMIKTNAIDQIAYELYQAEKTRTTVEKFVDRYPELDDDSLIKFKND